ncbi:hypothetical protein YC2023_038832 [Brassica napus]
MAQGGNFLGIYRKVQLKPLKWDGEGEEERHVEALMILKYGGVLTHAGRKQSEELGRFFRYNMYPGEGTGLFRLHSTYRHDLKIYSSDEGRVQVSLVSKDSSMLDGLDTASIEMEAAKLLFLLDRILVPPIIVVNLPTWCIYVKWTNLRLSNPTCKGFRFFFVNLVD